LGLNHLWIIYPGKISYDLNQHVSVIPLTELDKLA